MAAPSSDTVGPRVRHAKGDGCRAVVARRVLKDTAGYPSRKFKSVRGQ
jgi:hypothetical protein